MVEKMVVSKAVYWAFWRVGLRAGLSAAWRDSPQAVHWVGTWGECWAETTAGQTAAKRADWKVAHSVFERVVTMVCHAVVTMADWTAVW
jgi:hypothetical protein